MAFAIPAALTAVGVGAETAATIGTIASVVGTGMSVFGALQSGKAASQSAKYNAAVATNNQEIANQNARYAAQEGEVNAARKQQETRAKIGGVLAEQGASGVDVNSGSAVDTRASASEVGAEDALTIRSNAARQAYGYQTQATNYGAEAELDKSKAKSSATSGYINAGSTFLSGLGESNKNGAFDSLVGSKSLSGAQESASGYLDDEDFGINF